MLTCSSATWCPVAVYVNMQASLNRRGVRSPVPVSGRTKHHSLKAFTGLEISKTRVIHVKCSSSSGGSHNAGSSNRDGSSAGKPQAAGADHSYPKNEQDCSKSYKNQAVHDKLKPLWGWDVEGLPKHHTSRRGVSNVVQLSTYADAIGDNLTDLTEFLHSLEVQDAIGGLHVLPIYPSTGDRGFAPVTYQEVEPSIGTWEQVQSLAEEYQLCLDFMVNHISPASPQFQDFIANGEASPYHDMFVHWKSIWPKGGPSAAELAKIRTRKPAPPVIAVELADGTTVPLWNTFHDQQMDINPFTEEGWKFTEASLQALCEKGKARLLRLDAFGYVTKKPGTSCFMQDPEVWELLTKIKEVVRPYGVQLLCEVHEDFKLNIELARHGYWVYDFALPLLMLHALKFKTAEPLRHWLSICPRRQITTLDTHDGMGVDDVAGLAPLVDVPELEKSILCRGGSINYKHFYIPAENFEEDEQADIKAGHTHCKKTCDTLNAVKDFLQPDCLQGCYKSVPHQYNETYFSALGEDPKAYLLARAIQFFTPGVPMVYYVGLLAGRDDIKLMQQTGGIRDINRHRYTVEEAKQEATRPVVQALLQLCRFRNSHPAFHGRVFIDDTTAPHQLHVRWYSGSQHMAVLWADMATHDFSISHTPYMEEVLGEDAVLTDMNNSVSSPYTLDAASIFSIDTLDMEARAARRKQMVQETQKELQGWMQKQQSVAAVSASDTGNGSGSSSPNASDDVASSDANGDGMPARANFVGGGDEAEELFSEALKSADSWEYLEARKASRKMTASEGMTAGSGAYMRREKQSVEMRVERQMSSSSNGNGSSSSSSSSAKGNGSNGSQPASCNGDSDRHGDTARDNRTSSSRVAALAAAASIGNDSGDAVGRQHRSQSIATAAALSEASDSEEEELAEADSSVPRVGAGAGKALANAAGEDFDVDGNGVGDVYERQLQDLDLSWAWKLPDKPAEETKADVASAAERAMNGVGKAAPSA